MSQDKVFCEYCRNSVNYSVFRRVKYLAGKEYACTYTEYYGVCDDCNKEIYVGSLHDATLRAYKEAFGKLRFKEKEEDIK